MPRRRVVGVDIPLTDEQKKVLKQITGEDLNSIFVAAKTIVKEKVQHESDSLEDRELIRALYEADNILGPTLDMGTRDARFEGLLAAAVVW
jgi:hypothetical protein